MGCGGWIDDHVEKSACFTTNGQKESNSSYGKLWKKSSGIFWNQKIFGVVRIEKGKLFLAVSQKPLWSWRNGKSKKKVQNTTIPMHYQKPKITFETPG